MAKLILVNDDYETFRFTEADATLVIVKNKELSAVGDGIVASGVSVGRTVVVDGKVTASGSGVVFGGKDAGDIDGSIVVSVTGSIEAQRNGLSAVAEGMDVVIRGTVNSRLTGMSVSGERSTVSNEGTVASTVTNALVLSGAASQAVNNGRLSGQKDAAVISGDHAILTNNGSIGSTTGTGVVASGIGILLTNNGEIGARGHGIVATGDGEVITNNKSIGAGGSAIIARGKETIVTNSGALNAGGDGIALAGDQGVVTNRKTIEVGGVGMRIVADGAIVNNLGTVKGTLGIIVTGEDVRGANSGTITGYKSIAVDYTHADQSSFNNSGVLVSASGQAFKGGAGQQSLTNSGTIKGDVDLGAGNDYFDGTGGTVLGHVAGGAGNDTYVVSNIKTLLLESKAGGTDDVRASVGFTLGENFETLTLTGSRAIAGTGNAAANQIHGNSAANAIDGKAGKDMLWGHAGADRLTGGAGADQFVFSTGDGRDTITDFSASGSTHDILDISSLTSITDFKDLIQNHAKQVGSDVMIDGLDGDSILLKNVKIAQLDKHDFYF